MEKLSTSMKKVTVGDEKLVPQPLADKVPGGTEGSPVRVVTNASKMSVRKNLPFFLYDVRMYALFPSLGSDVGDVKRKELTKQSRDDYPEQERKAKTVAIFLKLLADHHDFFGDTTIYDRAALLISLKELAIPEGEAKEFRKPFDYIPGFATDCLGIEVVLKKAQTQDGSGFQCTSNDVNSAASLRSSKSDKSILEVLNLAVSQEAFFQTDRFVTYGNGVHYLYDPLGEDFGFKSADCPPLVDGKYVGIGVCKSVKMVEGGLMVVTDIKKTAFHQDHMPLIEKIAGMDIFTDARTGQSNFAPDRITPHQRREVEKQLRGLHLLTTYGKTRSVKVKGVGDAACNIQVSLRDGNRKSLVRYFQDDYQKTLKYPNLFTIDAGENRYYPCELLVVAPNQRVTGSQQTPDQVAEMIKASAALPADRLRQTKTMKEPLGLTSDSDRLKKCGITVSDALTTVPARVLPSPVVIYGNGKTAEVVNNCKWTSAPGLKFYDPATIGKYAVVGLFTPVDRKFDLQSYVNQLFQRCRARGMNVGQCAFFEVARNPNVEAVEWYFERALREGVTYMLFISSDSLKLHGVIKKLEVQTQILTQEIKKSKAFGVLAKGQMQTLDNVVAKINSKNDGLNFIVGSNSKLCLDDPRLCIIAFEFSHPPKLTGYEVKRGDKYRMPSVLGWSANCSNHSQKFVGDYLFEEPHQSDSMSQNLGKLTTDILRRFRANRKNEAPNHIYFYFTGVSEGEWNLVPDLYVEEIKKGLKSLSPSYSPHITAVVCSKMHLERFYKEKMTGNRAPEQNVAPGTVVDTTVTSPVVTEFFLNSHLALQGTAKTPKYAVLVDTAKWSLDQHEQLAHSLSFLHEIVNATVSVPVPLIVADRCAKRGLDVYKAAMFGSNDSSNADLNVELANRDLTNAGQAAANGRSLANTRYNA